MKLRLVRSALFLYPPSWRRRYGAEIEAWVLDSAAERSSGLDSARLVVDLVAFGLALRFRRFGAGARVTAVVALSVVAAVCVDAATLGNSVDAQGAPAPVSDITLSPHALLANNVTVVHSFSEAVPAGFALQPRRVEVYIAPGSSRITGISGRASAVLNPQTGQVLSIRSDR